MKPKIINSIRHGCLLLAILIPAAPHHATAQVIDVLDETILLNNGAPNSENTADAEDNFGGRVELIIGNNSGNARAGLLRFDVTPVGDAINDASQTVSVATLVLNTADAREDIQPTTETIFDVYAVVPENAGWVEGTQAGSRAGWSGEAGSPSQLFLANPEFEPDDPLGPGLDEEFDDVRLWHSGVQNDDMAIPFELGVDTQEISIGTASTDDIDGDGFLTINLDAGAVNSLLPSWLAGPEDNAGIYIFPTEGDGQWFFESNEGFEDEAVDLSLTFEAGGLAGDFDGSGALDAADVDALVSEIGEQAPDARFDVNGDSAVDGDDLTHWVKELRKTWIGDANLDGEFNSGDLVGTFAIGKYETGDAAGWADGDWDGDQLFGSADFVAAFSDGGYEQGPRRAVASVPEPATHLLVLLGLFGLGRFRKS